MLGRSSWALLTYLAMTGKWAARGPGGRTGPDTVKAPLERLPSSGCPAAASSLGAFSDTCAEARMPSAFDAQHSLMETWV